MASCARFVVSYADVLTVRLQARGAWGVRGRVQPGLPDFSPWVALRPPSPIGSVRTDLLPKREKEAALKDRGQLRIAFFVCLLMIKEGIAS